MEIRRSKRTKNARFSGDEYTPVLGGVHNLTHLRAISQLTARFPRNPQAMSDKNVVAKRGLVRKGDALRGERPTDAVGAPPDSGGTPHPDFCLSLVTFVLRQHLRCPFFRASKDTGSVFGCSLLDRVLKKRNTSTVNGFGRKLGAPCR